MKAGRHKHPDYQETPLFLFLAVSSESTRKPPKCPSGSSSTPTANPIDPQTFEDRYEAHIHLVDRLSGNNFPPSFKRTYLVHTTVENLASQQQQLEDPVRRSICHWTSFWIRRALPPRRPGCLYANVQLNWI
ncbi:hypothetical protein ASPBRDRAFT_32059 [Aspergillus brasiliensis CBS 101740]|uniref:EthD domain-containing protein n=1 Tax=Aspergillus brasiliensis (strain CBS 101740 / IMI 381727 / IBT 21946) TaxID=767769 RepID=A0A1L9UEV2_ASPBC|nr:hypothetical protein ASPBRDRAFT_32059 [Aspergillus brasiliensis CBS 101740]